MGHDDHDEKFERDLLDALEALRNVGQELAYELQSIGEYLQHQHDPVRFLITKIGEDTMSVPLGGVVGTPGNFSETPLDANGNIVALPSGVIPTWTSSDPTIASFAASADGTSVAVTYLAAGTYTGTCQASIPGGTVPNPSGTWTETVTAGQVGQVASFGITKNS
jgi:hypothetical protein